MDPPEKFPKAPSRPGTRWASGLAALAFLAGCSAVEQEPVSKLDPTDVPERIALVTMSGLLPIVDFGAQKAGTTTDKTVTLINRGVTSAISMRESSSKKLAAPYSWKGGTFPGAGGTCGVSALGLEQTCTLVISFSPTAEGAFLGTANVEYDNGVLFAPLPVALSGSTASALTISDGPTYAFPARAAGAGAEKTLTVTNSGGAPATAIMEDATDALAAPFSFKGGSYPGTGGSCGKTLNGAGGSGGNTCTLVIATSPTTTGSWSDQVRLKYLDGGAIQTAVLNVTASSPSSLTLTGSGSFGRRAKGSPTELSLTLSSGSGGAATLLNDASSLSSPFSFKGGSYPGTGGTCSTSLAASSSCTLGVKFEPTASATSTASISLAYDDGSTPGSRTASVTLPLSGIGLSGWSAPATSGLAARFAASAVWTGTEAIFWGGRDSPASVHSSGARYAPATDTWTTVSTTDPPQARYAHTAVWAGTKMIVWGGLTGADAPLGTGAMYDPTANSWTAITTAGAPSARYGHTSVWTGSRMIVWGGAEAGGIAASGLGYSFNPSSGANGEWTAISDGLANTPAARYHHVAVWTGSRMLVWGGCGSKAAQVDSCTNEIATGASYEPTGGTWSSMSTSGAPTPRYLHSATWGGSKFVAWGGGTDDLDDGSSMTALASGGTYDVGSDSWSPVSATGAPAARARGLVAWNGSRVVVWGGLDASGAGALYNPADNSWSAMSATGAPTQTYWTAGVAAESPDFLLVVFGGRGTGPAYSATAAVYAPE